MTEQLSESLGTYVGSSQPKTVLCLNCSPRASKHTATLMQNAVEALDSYADLEIIPEGMAGLVINGCKGCFERCLQDGKCWQQDDFEALAEKWLSADGIVLGSPVYSFGPPASVAAFFERMLALQRANPNRYFPKKIGQPIGIIAQGGSEYGGVEINAQSLLFLSHSIGCIPVSGDMPGFSQGVIGQIPDDDMLPKRMIEGAGRLAIRVMQAVDILSAGWNPITRPLRFLLASCGDEFEAEKFSERLMTSHVASDFSIDWRRFNFNNKQIAPCLGCTEFCSRDLECRFHDDMQNFRKEWLAADAIFWHVEANPGSPTTQIRASIDRMNQVRFETHFAGGRPHMPRYLKISVPAVYGQHDEAFYQVNLFLHHVSVLYQHLLIPFGETGNITLKGKQNTYTRSDKNEFSQSAIDRMLAETIRLALVVKSGLEQLSKTLPEEYYPSKTRYAIVEPATKT